MRNCSYNQPKFTLKDVKRTLPNSQADNLVCSSSCRNSVTGHGVTMHAHGDPRGVQCANCCEYGHCRNECPQNNDKKKRLLNGGKPNWRRTAAAETSTVSEGVAAAV